MEAVNEGLKPQDEGWESRCLPEFSPFPLSYASRYSILLEAGSVSPLQRGSTVQINTVSADHTSLIISEAAPNWGIDLLFFV